MQAVCSGATGKPTLRDVPFGWDAMGCWVSVGNT